MKHRRPVEKISRFHEVMDDLVSTPNIKNIVLSLQFNTFNLILFFVHPDF